MTELNLLVAYVRQTRRAAVGTALRDLHQMGWSESEVIGHGTAAAGHGVEHVRFEVLISEPLAGACREAIIAAAATGEPGDGLVVTLPVSWVDRIATARPALAGAPLLHAGPQATAAIDREASLP